MKKWKSRLLRLPVYLLILAALGYGVWQFMEQNTLPELFADALPTVPPPTGTTSKEPLFMPETIIGIGDSFEYWPSQAEGHLLCRVTGARVVRDASQCPQEALFFECGWLNAEVDGEWVVYEYPDWFTQGGAYDQGCRIVLVDLEVTNVDAVAWLDNGTFTNTGLFRDPYAFQANFILDVADLGESQGEEFREYSSDYFGGRGTYAQEDDLDTVGQEDLAIQVPPGQTVTCTFGYLLDGDNGKSRDLTKIYAILGADSYYKTGVFIDLELENE